MTDRIVRKIARMCALASYPQNERTQNFKINRVNEIPPPAFGVVINIAEKLE